MQQGASARRRGGFLPHPIFSVHLFNLQVDFLCHNPVTLAVLYEFDILIYSWLGFMELGASLGSPKKKKNLHMNRREGKE